MAAVLGQGADAPLAAARDGTSAWGDWPFAQGRETNHVSLTILDTRHLRRRPFVTHPACLNSGRRRDGVYRSEPMICASSIDVTPGLARRAWYTAMRWRPEIPARFSLSPAT
jgi:hypothetical protein